MAVRVLIVDDQEAFRVAAREVVASTKGFEVVGEASTGEASVEISRNLAPDLVLMDVNLPGIDGIEAGRRIRSAQRETIIFLLSTYDREEFGARIEASEITTFISKARFGPHSLQAAWNRASTGDSEGGPL